MKFAADFWQSKTTKTALGHIAWAVANYAFQHLPAFAPLRALHVDPTLIITTLLASMGLTIRDTVARTGAAPTEPADGEADAGVIK